MSASPTAADTATTSAAASAACASVLDATLTAATRGERDRDPLQLPAGVNGWAVRWPELLFIGGIHAVALLAVLPMFFSWLGLIVCVAGFYVFGGLGINLCYHRLLTHRSFTCPRWLERLFTLLAHCNLQGSSVRWVAAHRMHHQFSDERPDPHSPLVNLLWGHMGWLVVTNPALDSPGALERYAPDLHKDAFHRRFSHKNLWLLVWGAHVLAMWAIGFFVGWAWEGAAAGVWMGFSLVVWAVFVRSVVVWHITWAINSVTHLWGYQNYRSTDNSKNNWLLGYVAMGEGWHNNHHADQRSAAHGHRWWEVDVTYLTILLLKALRLADNVIKPARHADSQHSLERKRLRDGGE